MIESKGVVYIATGEKYRNEACRSAESLKAHMPHLPVTIFTNAPLENSAIDQVIIVENPYYGYSDKTQYIRLSPYEQTLFLDTDTYICADCLEIFTLLERFDIAVAHAPFRISSIDAGCPKDYHVEGVPDSFPEMNTGVILFKRHPRVAQFFSHWLALQEEFLKQEPNPPDQVTFRKALYDSELRIATLTSEYNCRFIAPVFVCRTVKILHGQHADLPVVAEQINAEQVARVFLEWDMYRQCHLARQWMHLQEDVLRLQTELDRIKGYSFRKPWTVFKYFKQLFRRA